MTDPLPRGQQLFLQRLMAAHVMTSEQAEELTQVIGEEALDCDPTNLNQLFTSINAQLTRGFGLEIATMIDDTTKQQYHAVINQHADAVAKESFSHIIDPSTRYFIRLVLEALVDNDGRPMARSTLINKRTELDDGKNKGAIKALELDQADKCMERLITEQWLQRDTSSKTKHRRDSMAAKIGLGPRAYLELQIPLIQMGYDKDSMPQVIFHRP